MTEFTLKRDAYQRERRATCLEPLRQQYAETRVQIDGMRRKLTGVRHHDQLIENDLKPVLFVAQDLWAELSSIESEMWIPYALGFVIRE